MSEALLRVIRALSDSDPYPAATFPWWHSPEKVPFSKVVDDVLSLVQRNETQLTSEKPDDMATAIYDLLGYLTLGLVLANKIPPEKVVEKLEFWCQEIREATEAPSSESRR